MFGLIGHSSSFEQAQARTDLAWIAWMRPELADLLELGLAEGALASVVSGSGPTVAMLARNAAHATQLAEALATKGVDAIATSGPSAPARIEDN